MSSKELVQKWFDVWDKGDFHNIPVTETFKHTSPFGTIDGKKTYLDLVESNKDKFLGYHFDMYNKIFEKDKACVRYTARQGKDFKLEVSEWYFIKNNLIEEIIAYYHIGEIREDRKLK